MEHKENTINKVDKVTETLIKEVEVLSEEGLHEFFMEETAANLNRTLTEEQAEVNEYYVEEETW